MARPNVSLMTGAVVVAGLVIVAAGGQAIGLESHAYVAGLVATFAGVVGGLPVALWLDRRRLDQESRQAKQLEEERLRRVAGLLKAELEAARKAIDELPQRPDSIRPPFVAYHVWSALSVSGELRGLPAPLLATVADAYRFVEVIAHVERDTYIAWLGPMGRKWLEGETRERVDERIRIVPFQDLMSNLNELRAFAQVAVRSAIEALGAAEAPASGT